jgi:hypothetical protein
MFNLSFLCLQPQGIFNPLDTLSTTVLMPVAFVIFSIESPSPFDFIILAFPSTSCGADTFIRSFTTIYIVHFHLAS